MPLQRSAPSSVLSNWIVNLNSGFSIWFLPRAGRHARYSGLSTSLGQCGGSHLPVFPICASYLGMKTNKRSLWKGAVAGLVGGMAGAVAKRYIERIYLLRLAEATRLPDPAAPLVERVENFSGESIVGIARHLPSTMTGARSPWVVGGLAGAAYGVAVEQEPTAAAWQGAAFGMAMNRVARAGILPMAGVSRASATGETESMEAKIHGGLSFAVFGIVTELVRRLVRRGLDGRRG